MIKQPKHFYGIYGLIIVLILFILISYIIQSNSQFIENNLDKTLSGILFYIFLTTTATIIAPISAVPLLPFAIFLWGWFFAAIFSIIGWTLGSVIAFSLARKFGVPIIKHFVSLKKLSKFEKYIPKEKIFLSIIVMRIFLPVDILSYLLGLFSKVKFSTYTLATIIGLTPFAFALAYLGKFSIKTQIISIIIGGLILAFIMIKYYKSKIKSKKFIQNS
jgi:uncharacterized membrane protein YdjX (TVP38/TMEM64 family)